jgi:ParB family chromosome partitioning protein
MAKPKRGLGKGLGALIVQESVDINQSEEQIGIQNFLVSKIIPNVNQPRKDFSEDKLSKLAESIKEFGVIQPIVLRRKDEDYYEIVAGERRWRASKLAGLKEIPGVLKDIDDDVFAEMALIENLQREDLNAIEEAIAYQYMMDAHQLTQDRLSKIIGKSRTYITNTLRLLKLSPNIQSLIKDGLLSTGHGRTLLGIKEDKEAYLLAKKVISEDISVRQLESIIKEIKVSVPKHMVSGSVKDPVIKDFETHLKNFFGTKVSIAHQNDKGKIQINYYSEEELNRILELLEYTI